MCLHACALLLTAWCLALSAQAETGYDLWLRYTPIEAQHKDRYAVSQLVAGTSSPTLDVARAELTRGLAGMLGAAPAVASAVTGDGALVIGTPASSTIGTISTARSSAISKAAPWRAR